MGTRLHPARGDHHGEAFDELAQDLPADAAVADHDAGAQRRGRSRSQQDRLDLAPAAQVRRQLIVVVAQSAEIDDLGQARAVRGVRERVRTGAVALGEAGVREGVHEVVRRVVTGERAPQAVGVADVGCDRCPGARVALGSPRDRGHVVTRVVQAVRDGRADEP